MGRPLATFATASEPRPSRNFPRPTSRSRPVSRFVDPPERKINILNTNTQRNNQIVSSQPQHTDSMTDATAHSHKTPNQPTTIPTPWIFPWDEWSDLVRAATTTTIAYVCSR